ncbi:MAG TPA: SRPBCC domain-containing protein [Phycisphaerales bacterium]|nr:SRPBCC domain-containing protein [Phycisphaerales bacterium]
MTISSPPATRTIRKSAVYPYTPADVWTAITNPHAIAEWLMPNDFQPVLGHRFIFQTDRNFVCGDVLVKCEVLELDPQRRMVWAWNRVKPDGSLAHTKVTWILTPEGQGTRLTLEHEGVERLPFIMRTLMGMGWGGILKDGIIKVLRNVNAERFTPGAIPLEKRYYKAKTVPPHLVR